jgi:hypothetical protein
MSELLTGVTPAYGPVRRSKLSLMGARFLEGDDPTDTPAPEPDPDPANEPPVEEDPNAGLKKALAAERAARKAADAEAARLKAEIAAKDKSAEEIELDKARAEARAEVTKQANERVLKAELRAQATGQLADPADALAFIDLSQFDVADDGQVDGDALNEAIADLLKRKPHLATPTGPEKPSGSADGGAGAPPKPTQNLDEQIAAATAAGNVRLAVSLQNQKLQAS